MSAGLFFAASALVLHKLDYGALYKSEFILRFSFEQQHGSESYLNVIRQHARRFNLLHIEPSGDSAILSVTYDIVLQEGTDAGKFASLVGELEGISEVTLIASKNDIDY